MKFHKKVVDFGLLYEMACETGEDAIADVISILAMNDIPMSDAVIKLGIVLDILLPGYHNGWAEEMENEI